LQTRLKKELKMYAMKAALGEMPCAVLELMGNTKG
jgi:hypothetical protein